MSDKRKNHAKARRRGEGAMRHGRKGEGPATVIFWIAVALVAGLVLLGLLLPDLSKSHRPRARRVNCAGNLKQIGLALIIYAGDDRVDGYFPDGGGFRRLHEGRYLTNGKVYSCPSSEKPNTLADESNYVYLGSGLKDTNAQSTKVILAHDRIGNHANWVNCLYLDGHVKGHSSSATTWEAFRAEREAAGDIIAHPPMEDVSSDELPTYQGVLKDE